MKTLVLTLLCEYLSPRRSSLAPRWLELVVLSGLTGLVSCLVPAAAAGEFSSMDTWPGENVTLLCSNFSSFPAHVYWFKLGNGTNSSWISRMLDSEKAAVLLDGFQSGKFNMTSNGSVIFLWIGGVDTSDSGLYFCGRSQDGHPLIVSATHLKVKAALREEANVTTVILSALTLLLVVTVVALSLAIRKRRTVPSGSGTMSGSVSVPGGAEAPRTPRGPEEVDSGSVSYAAVKFKAKPECRRGTAAERLVEADVVYAATARKTRGKK